MKSPQDFTEVRRRMTKGEVGPILSPIVTGYYFKIAFRFLPSEEMF